MAVLILFTWIQTGYEHVILLTGKVRRLPLPLPLCPVDYPYPLCPQVAEPDALSLLTYVAAHHDSRITHVDTVRAYYSGARLIAEVDVVLPREMSHGDAHNIGDSLQRAIERVAFVERAFVHLDYEYSHSAKEEHATTA